MSNVTGKTNTLVRDWMCAKSRLARAEMERESAIAALKIAENELGGWLLPIDAHYGEKFNLWFGSGVLTAEIVDAGEHTCVVCWRKEPDGVEERSELGM